MTPYRSSELFIDKPRLAVTVVMRGGRRLDGEIFVPASRRALGHSEGVPEFMNSGDRFFPLLLPDDRVSLVAKAQLVAVHFSRDQMDESVMHFGDPTEAAVTMDDGTTFCGEFLLPAISPHPRVLDHLNHATESFLPLIQEDRVTLVARDHIVQVTEPSNGAA